MVERNGHLAELGLNSGFSTPQQCDHRLFPYDKIRIITFSIVAVAAVVTTVLIDHINSLSERPGFLGSIGRCVIHTKPSTPLGLHCSPQRSLSREVHASARDRGQGPEAISQEGPAFVPAPKTWDVPASIWLHLHQAPVHESGAGSLTHGLTVSV